METKLSVRDRIFQAALERIKHYGYGKTTMAEIAADCAMSPGNIYRFFEAKIDIAEAIARNHDASIHTRLSAIARRQDLPADARLREVLGTKMRENYSLLQANPKIIELAEVVHRERPLLANEELAHERVFLTQILRDGVDSGLFDVPDPEFTAEMIQVATMKFSFPQLFSKLTLAKLERELNGVITLILNGIYAKGAPGSTSANEN
jgi:AcrR family transcriptional regulator